MALESVKNNLSNVSIFNNSGQNSGSNSGAKPDLATAVKSETTRIKGDGATVQSTKGGIPSSGLFSSNKPDFITKAEQTVSKLSTNKKTLEGIVSALDKIDPNKGIDSLSDDDINNLLTLGFDVSEENGKLTISDADGNKVDINQFMKSKDELKNTIQRTISGTQNKEGTLTIGDTGKDKGNSGSTVTTKMTQAEEEKLLAVAQIKADTDSHIKNVSEPLKQNLETALKEYDSLVLKSKQQTQKVDNSISNILSLKDQAQALVSKAKTQPLSDIEKKQLNSIITTMQMKQKELQANQAGSETLMKQVEQTYAKLAPNLSPSERETSDVMQSALKAKVSGQAMSARQDFVTALSEEAFKITSQMTPDEKEKFINDPNIRMKTFSNFNRIIDKMSTVTKVSDFSADETKMLWEQLKIKVVDENGKASFYHYASDGTSEKLSSKDFKDFRTDLNNIVKSPELFNMATLTGQIALAYEKPASSSDKPVIVEGEKTELDKASNSKSNNTNVEKSDNTNAKVNVTKPETKDGNAKLIERTALDASLLRKNEEKKYHEKQISGIHEKRQEINKYLEKKRVANKEELSTIEKDATDIHYDQKELELLNKEKIETKAK